MRDRLRCPGASRNHRDGGRGHAFVAQLRPIRHFEHFWAGDQYGALRQLADFTIDHHYPHCRDEANPYLALLSAVCDATAELVAHWQAVGFCHGVMNTDNMSILGLTIDYGPFGFLDGFNAHHICNHSDAQGRYAYQAQPNVAYWNLFCLAQALLPLFGEGEAAIEQAQSVLPAFKTRFAEEIDLRMRAKLGLRESHADDEALINRLFKLMHEGRVDFTHLFRTLAGLELENPAADTPLRGMFIDRAGFDAWAVDYRARLRHEASTDAKRAVAMRLVNPKYILRNHLAEIAIRRARERTFGSRHVAQGALAPLRRTARIRTLCRAAARLGRATRGQLLVLIDGTARHRRDAGVSDASARCHALQNGASPHLGQV